MNDSMVSALLFIKCLLLAAGVSLILSCKGIHSWSTTTNHWSTRSTVVITPTANHHHHWWRYQNQIHNHRHIIATKLYMSSSKGNHIIEVLHQPDSSFLSSKGVLDWPTWGCPISKFPWSYSETEICYLIRGKVMITPIINNNNNNDDDGSPPPTPVTIAAGDYVTLPAGLSCTWDVLEAVEKHYMFN